MDSLGSATRLLGESSDRKGNKYTTAVAAASRWGPNIDDRPRADLESKRQGNGRLSAWEADVLPLNYIRRRCTAYRLRSLADADLTLPDRRLHGCKRASVPSASPRGQPIFGLTPRPSDHCGPRQPAQPSQRDLWETRLAHRRARDTSSLPQPNEVNLVERPAAS